MLFSKQKPAYAPSQKTPLRALLTESLCCLAIIAAAAPTAVAMDALTQSEMGNIAGQAGISMTATGTFNIKTSFNAVKISDPDKTGWLVIQGSGSPSIATMTNSLLPGDMVILDFATTTGAVTIDDVGIPANTTFMSGSLPSIYPSVQAPQNMTVGLANASGTIAKTLGVLRFNNPTIEGPTIEEGYLWANP